MNAPPPTPEQTLEDDDEEEEDEEEEEEKGYSREKERERERGGETRALPWEGIPVRRHKSEEENFVTKYLRGFKKGSKKCRNEQKKRPN